MILINLYALRILNFGFIKNLTIKLQSFLSRFMQFYMNQFLNSLPKKSQVDFNLIYSQIHEAPTKYLSIFYFPKGIFNKLKQQIINLFEGKSKYEMDYNLSNIDINILWLQQQ